MMNPLNPVLIFEPQTLINFPYSSITFSCFMYFAAMSRNLKICSRFLLLSVFLNVLPLQSSLELNISNNESNIRINFIVASAPTNSSRPFFINNSIEAAVDALSVCRNVYFHFFFDAMQCETDSFYVEE